MGISGIGYRGTPSQKKVDYDKDFDKDNNFVPRFKGSIAVPQIALEQQKKELRTVLADLLTIENGKK